jgi:hypothetical protein
MLALSASAENEPAGVLWETMSQSVMEGMPFAAPPMKATACTHATWTAPPPSGDNTCTNSNFHDDGSKVTWTMQCSGQMPMSGNGEITFDAARGSYDGQILASAQGMAITVKLAGKKLGTCDDPR